MLFATSARLTQGMKVSLNRDFAALDLNVCLLFASDYGLEVITGGARALLTVATVFLSVRNSLESASSRFWFARDCARSCEACSIIRLCSLFVLFWSCLDILSIRLCNLYWYVCASGPVGS